MSLTWVQFCLIVFLESSKQLLTCAESCDKAGEGQERGQRSLQAAGEAEGGACDEGNVQQ